MSGKIPPKIMEKVVYVKLGAFDPSVLVGPAVGEDAAVIDLENGRVLVVHNDAITGASEFLGWLAVHIVANDIAVRGAKPRWFLISLFLPEGVSENILEKIATQVDGAARGLGIMVVGGHTETTSGLNRPLAGTTAIGIAEKSKIVTTSGARTGDYVIMTKTAAIEGTAILCTDFANSLRNKGIDDETLERGSKFLWNISVVREALALAERGLATSMHDPTEGGILGGVAEIAYASRKTIEFWADRVPVAEETKIVTKALNIDSLKLISSGALMAAVSPTNISEALSVLEKLGVEATVVGKVKDYEGHLVEVVKGSTVELVRDVYVADELFRLWKRIN
ncbi:MAG: AIR synthase family protein [Candidatus Bathyarchaeia archaeon]